MNGSMIEIHRNTVKLLNEILKSPNKSITSDEKYTTENSFYSATKLLSGIAFDNLQQDENASATPVYTTIPPDSQNYTTTVYTSYPSEILWFAAVSCILLSILGTTGNLISILALVKCKRLRNATTMFIVNLCVSDMLYCSFTMPLNALTFIDRDWYYGAALCKLFALVKFSNGLQSIFTVVAITINRYVLIVFPTLYQTLYSTRNTAISIACLWLFPLILISFPLFNVWGQLNYNPKVGDCGVNNLNGKSPRALIFFMILILPSIIFIACYTKIYFVVKRTVGAVQKRDEHRLQDGQNSAGESVRAQNSNNANRSSIRVEMRDKKEFRVLRIVLVIFIFYTLSIFPISLIKLFRKEGELKLLNVFGYVFYFSASVINPVVYIVMSREYRMAYKELFMSKLCFN